MAFVLRTSAPTIIVRTNRRTFLQSTVSAFPIHEYTTQPHQPLTLRYSTLSLTMVDVAAQRIVPGAPPPTPLSKNQKKKRKTKPKNGEVTADSPIVAPDTISAAVSEKAVEISDIQETTPAPEPSAQLESEAVPVPEDDLLVKLSPIVDLIHKRLKATTKKIVSPSLVLRMFVINAFLDPDISLCFN